jgi:putative ABC transport system permease protein
MALVPLKYNLRNLSVRWPTTLLTVLVAAIVVACSCVLFGLVDGLMYSQAVSGDPLTILVMRKGADSETTSYFTLQTVQDLATLNGIAKGRDRTPEEVEKSFPDAKGQPLVAGELLNIPVMNRSDGTRVNLTIRGATPASPYLRPSFQIIEGRYFRPGTRECIVSRSLTKRFAGGQLGQQLRVSDKEAYDVVGIFSANSGAAESEVWTGREDLAANTNNESSVSTARIRVVDNKAFETLSGTITNDTRFGQLPKRETVYYQSQNLTLVFLAVIGTIIAVLLTIGALFAAANTMFAAVKSRTREIGTMRALGFSRTSILLSFLLEAVIITAIGGAIGALLSLLFSNWSFGISDFTSFSERVIRLRFGALPLAVALGMTLAMGVFGGLFPAIRAVRLDVVKSLREL